MGRKLKTFSFRGSFDVATIHKLLLIVQGLLTCKDTLQLSNFHVFWLSAVDYSLGLEVVGRPAACEAASWNFSLILARFTGSLLLDV